LDETTIRWEAVENGQPRYLTDVQAAILMLEWGTSEAEAKRIIEERRPWSWKRETEPIFALELKPLAWDSPGAPVCPSCREEGGIEVSVRGWIAPPPEAGPERILVCRRCKRTMKDRRGSTRR
jgi:hypothetical protein